MERAISKVIVRQSFTHKNIPMIPGLKKYENHVLQIEYSFLEIKNKKACIICREKWNKAKTYTVTSHSNECA